jgi:hypothetical protein
MAETNTPDDVVARANDPAAVRSLIRAERRAAQAARSREGALRAELQRQARTLATLRARAEGAESQLAAMQARESEALRALTERLEEVENDFATVVDQNRRLRVAIDTGVPVELADRLVGATAEELAADAYRLLSLRPIGPR